MKGIKIFLILMAIGLTSALVPLLHVSVIFGFPAVLINSLILTMLYCWKHEIN